MGTNHESASKEVVKKQNMQYQFSEVYPLLTSPNYKYHGTPDQLHWKASKVESFGRQQIIL